MPTEISFEAFREQWLAELRASDPSPMELGRRFAQKLFTQWRNISDPGDDLIFLDAREDIGFDLAYLERGDSAVGTLTGDTWYFVEAKLGDHVESGDLLLRNWMRFVDLLARKSAIKPGSFLTRISEFLSIAQTDDRADRLVLVIATEMPLSDKQKASVDQLRTRGRELLGPVFDVAAVSIETIYLNTLDDTGVAEIARVRVPIKANMKPSGQDLLIGSVALPDLYEFLEAYRDQTEDLDQLYEKNVRQFLGGRRRVNKGIKETLEKMPEQFGLYNNGITIVVNNFKEREDGTFELVQPYIVNGCQTTRTIWDAFRQKLEIEKKADPIQLEKWQARAINGVVVTKIVRVGGSNEKLLQNITRFTNSQNAVSEKDFVTLDEGFQRWKTEMADKYDIFLEIQRGGWDSRQALQKQNPKVRQFSRVANAFDLLKVYGSGWLREAGTAFGRNAAFVPGGTLYRQIVERDGVPFGVNDLYATYLLQTSAIQFGFGRGSQKTSRRQTRYLYFLVAVDLLRDVMIRANLPTSPSDLTEALIRLFHHGQGDTARELLDAAVGVVDEYLTQGEEDSVFTEPAFKDNNRFNQDLNGFLKWEKLGKGEDTPSFSNLMAINKRTMGRGQPSPRQLIEDAIH
jgi:hypothetical protein